MDYTNKYEVALFVMCRQRLVYLGWAAGKTPEQVNIEAYRQMQNLIADEDVEGSAVDLENTKHIAEVYG